MEAALYEPGRTSSRSLSDFEILRLLGEGSLSSVVSARCRRSGKVVAVKMYHAARLSPRAVRAVAREVRVHGALRHPGVVRLQAAWRDAQGMYLVQSLAPGGDLFHALAREGGVLSERRAARDVLAPLLRTLAHLHARGVLHRDIKPENLLLDARGRVVLADFGLAIDLGCEAPLSRVGTLDYLAPEIVRLGLGGEGSKGGPASGLCPQTGGRGGAGNKAGNQPPPPEPSPANGHPRPRALAQPAPVSALHLELQQFASQQTAAEPTLGAAAPAPVRQPAPSSQTRMRAPPAARYGFPVDIWCLGILAYEVLVGGPPFEAASRESTYTRILKAEIFMPEHLSIGARDFILQTLRRDPDQRPTAEQLLQHPWIQSLAGGAGAAAEAESEADVCVEPEPMRKHPDSLAAGREQAVPAAREAEHATPNPAGSILEAGGSDAPEMVAHPSREVVPYPGLSQGSEGEEVPKPGSAAGEQAPEPAVLDDENALIPALMLAHESPHRRQSPAPTRLSPGSPGTQKPPLALASHTLGDLPRSLSPSLLLPQRLRSSSATSPAQVRGSPAGSRLGKLSGSPSGSPAKRDGDASPGSEVLRAFGRKLSLSAVRKAEDADGQRGGEGEGEANVEFMDFV
ncbi:protein kinase [Helicosporidium sp. ATCC 50920]|nr:protein kinase [Helicosporidium sp. ATCC 50920]|eukprot:KDD76635.1 protein kinase [Helicosporidium sp. ATCC 50920]